MSSAIQMSTHPHKSLHTVLVLRVKGSIDSDTAPAFERQLETLLEQKHHRLLVDLSDVEYISSAGIGIFVGMVQRFRALPQGDLKVCRAAKKVMKVFDAIGLSDLLDFFDDEAGLKQWSAAAVVADPMDHFVLHALDAEIYSGEEFTLRVEGRDAKDRIATDYSGRPKLAISQGLIFPGELEGVRAGVWEGRVAVTAVGPVTLTVSDGKWQGTTELRALEKQDKAGFPLTVSCHTCQAAITVKEPDIYRCETCDETFVVDAWGHVFTLKPGSTAKRRKSRYKGMELKINADVNYLSVVRQTIAGLCGKEGMDDTTTNSVAMAIEEILLNLIEHGNDFDPWQILRIRLDFQKKQLKVTIRDYGDPYDVTKHKEISLKSSVAKGSKRGLGTFLVNQLMDEVKYVSEENYNELTMIKRYGAAPEEDEE
jgi:anti-sigma B factor antagonist